MKQFSNEVKQLARIETNSGRILDFLNPTPEMIHISDIATGLGNTCRWAGQINDFFSVAQHSILVARLAPLELQKPAILHDAAEAFIHDVSKPLKILLGDAYGSIETNFNELIFYCFGVDIKLLPKIKPFDKMVETAEHARFKRNDHAVWQRFCFDLRHTNLPLTPKCAGAEFLDEYFTIFDVQA